MITRYDFLATSAQGGTTGEFGFWLPEQDDAAAANIVAHMQMFTEAYLWGVLASYYSTQQPTPRAPGTVPQVGTCARMVFPAAAPNAGRATIQLPMPNSSVYLADHHTVNVAVLAPLLTAIQTSCCTPGGVSLAALSSGRWASYPLPLWPQYP